MQRTPAPDIATAVAEPALRPCGQRAPNLAIVRQARLYWDGRSLVLRAPGAPERRFPVGPGGVERAIHINIYGEEAARRMPPAGEWGALELQNGQGQRLLRIPLMDWLPEASSALSRPVEGELLLQLTGASGLLKAAEVPLSVVTSLDDPLLAHSSRGPDTDIHICRALPVWHSVLRGVSMAVWLVCLVTGLLWRDSAPWLLVVSAAALAGLPVIDAQVRMRGRLGGRHYPIGVQSVISPVPGVDTGATRRFCAIAEIRVQDSDVVVVDSLGRERWLARTGPHGVTRLVRVLDPANREPIAVELRGSGGHVRAALPWRSWFAGAGGEARWREFTGALGRPVEDRPAPNAGSGKPWPRGGVALADAESMAPLSPRSARRGSDFHRSVLQDRTAWVVPLFALPTLLGGLGIMGSDHVLGITTTAFAALAILATLGPVVAHHLNSRFNLDRPAPSQEATQ